MMNSSQAHHSLSGWRSIGPTEQEAVQSSADASFYLGKSALFGVAAVDGVPSSRGGLVRSVSLCLFLREKV